MKMVKSNNKEESSVSLWDDDSLWAIWRNSFRILWDSHWVVTPRWTLDVTRLSLVHCLRSFENNFVKGSAVRHKNGDWLATGRWFVYALEIRSDKRTKQAKDSIKLMHMSKGYWQSAITHTFSHDYTTICLKRKTATIVRTSIRGEYQATSKNGRKFKHFCQWLRSIWNSQFQVSVDNLE